MACCVSNFSSDVLNVPDCALACLSTAEPGAIFVGADGSIWILTGDDPCNVGDWTQNNNDCCFRIVGMTGLVDICCNESVTFDSPDDTINIDVVGTTIQFTSKIGTPIPVAKYTYIMDGLSGQFDGCSSTSTHQNVGITYAWVATGPGAATIANATGCNTAIDFSTPGMYDVTLTVTDDNGQTNYFTETVCVKAKADCETHFEIPAGAFALPGAPTDAEVSTWVTANGPFNNGTVLWYGGTVNTPNYVWLHACSN